MDTTVGVRCGTGAASSRTPHRGAIARPAGLTVAARHQLANQTESSSWTEPALAPGGEWAEAICGGPGHGMGRMDRASGQLAVPDTPTAEITDDRQCARLPPVVMLSYHLSPGGRVDGTLLDLVLGRLNAVLLASEAAGFVLAAFHRRTGLRGHVHVRGDGGHRWRVSMGERMCR